MIASLTFDGALDLVAGRVDQAWLDELRSTPDGEALLGLLIDLFVAIDGEDAARASSLFVVPHSAQVAPPGSGAQYASITLGVTLRRSLKTTRAITLPAGSPVETPDGHAFLTDATLTWGVGEVGVAKFTTATAVLPGRLQVPPGEVRAFKPVVEGLSGEGLSVALLPGGGTQPKALRLRTDTDVPHAFRPELVGRYLELTGLGTGGEANEGRVLQISATNDGSSQAAAGATENEYAWGSPTDTTVDAWMAPWAVGTFAFTWRAVEWGEVFSVVNTAAATGGGDAILDETAQGRGRPRQTDEDDEQLRSRLARTNNPPTPLGALRAAITALVPWGFGRPDVRIYELGEPAADADVDPYAANFPASLGFISDLHCTDMSTPETPDGMANQDPSYATLSPFFNPGLALIEPGAARWVVVVRWEPPGSMPSDTVATVRRLLFSALKNAKPGGCIVQLYFPEQWSYPA